MKNLIMIFVLFITTSLFAQEKVTQSNKVKEDQSHKCMTQIAVDSEMRVKMMNMMLGETEKNEKEMMKLVNVIFNNSEMNSMIMKKNAMSTERDNLSLESRGMQQDEKEKVNTLKYTKPIKRNK